MKTLFYSSIVNVFESKDKLMKEVRIYLLKMLEKYVLCISREWNDCQNMRNISAMSGEMNNFNYEDTDQHVESKNSTQI